MSAVDAVAKLHTGAEIPLLAFGTSWQGSDLSLCKDAIKAAILDAKYKHIDTAWYYGTEKFVGEVLEEVFDSKKVKREDIFITTKVWPCYWNDPENSVAISLKDLRLEYVDLLLQHWPVCFQKVEDSEGNRVPIPKDKDGNILFDKDGDYLITYKKLLKLKDEGKAKAIGVSNFTIEMLERVINETGVIPVVNQIEFHPHLTQPDLYEYCMSKGILIEAYAPFGSSGAPNLKLPIITTLAKKYDVSAADIIVNFCIAKQIVALPRSANIERIKKGYPLIKDFATEDIESLDKYGEQYPERYVRSEWGSGLGFAYWDKPYDQE